MNLLNKKTFLRNSMLIGIFITGIIGFIIIPAIYRKHCVSKSYEEEKKLLTTYSSYINHLESIKKEYYESDMNEDDRIACLYELKEYAVYLQNTGNIINYTLDEKNNTLYIYFSKNINYSISLV